MKKIIFGLLGVTLMFLGINSANAQAKLEGKKVLVVYYSHSGNTKTVAEAIHNAVGGDIIEITTNHKYPDEYRPMTEQAKVEIAEGFRPELTSKVDNISQYDVIFIGSPNWWGTISPIVSSFLDNNDLSGKTVIPFITHGGGGEQRTVTDLTAQCKGCTVEKGWIGSGSSTSGLDNWLNNLKL